VEESRARELLHPGLSAPDREGDHLRRRGRCRARGQKDRAHSLKQLVLPIPRYHRTSFVDRRNGGL